MAKAQELSIYSTHIDFTILMNVSNEAGLVILQPNSHSRHVWREVLWQGLPNRKLLLCNCCQTRNGPQVYMTNYYTPAHKNARPASKVFCYLLLQSPAHKQFFPISYNPQAKQFSSGIYSRIYCGPLPSYVVFTNE